MKRTALIAMASTAALLLVGPSVAQTPPPPASQPPAQRSAPMPSSSSDMGGRHTMDGEVTKVDAKRGWVDVKTPEGRMKLHYPPPALDSVKVGDRVTVEIGFRTAKQ